MKILKKILIMGLALSIVLSPMQVNAQSNTEELKIEYANQSVRVGLPFDEEKITVKIISADGTEKNINYEDLTVKPKDQTVLNMGWNSYDVAYNDLTATLNVHGYDIVKLEARHDHCGCGLGVGDDLTKRNCLTVYGTTSMMVDYSMWIAPIDFYTIDNPIMEKEGANTVVIRYKDLTSTIDMYASLRIKDFSYEYKDELPLIGETFDPNKLIIKFNYTNNTSKTFSFNEFSSYDEYNPIFEASGNKYTFLHGCCPLRLYDLYVKAYELNEMEASYEGPVLKNIEDINKDNIVVIANYTDPVTKEAFTKEIKDYQLTFKTKDTATILYKGYELDLTFDIHEENEHDWNKNLSNIKPNCEVNTYISYICNICKEERNEMIPAVGHDFEEFYTTDIEPTETINGEKSRHCRNCDARTDITTIEKISHEHSWTGGAMLIAPTCTTEGSSTFICGVCNYRRVEILPVVDHSYNDFYTTDIEPTEETEGEKSRHCKNCDARTDIRTIDKIEKIGPPITIDEEGNIISGNEIIGKYDFETEETIINETQNDNNLLAASYIPYEEYVLSASNDNLTYYYCFYYQEWRKTLFE